MRILVTGSRSWRDAAAIARVIKRAPVGSVVIQGGAAGADRIAAKAAAARGLQVVTVPAQWERDGRAAGMKRNAQMLAMDIDVVLAFWDGSSRGTAHTIRTAQAMGIKVWISGRGYAS